MVEDVHHGDGPRTRVHGTGDGRGVVAGGDWSLRGCVVPIPGIHERAVRGRLRHGYSDTNEPHIPGRTPRDDAEAQLPEARTVDRSRVDGLRGVRCTGASAFALRSAVVG